MERRADRDPRVLTRGPARAIGAAVAWALALACAGPALAQDGERARVLFEQGVTAMREERFEAAARAFRASYDAAPRVATMCNLALAYDRWGAHPEVALESYARCAEEDESGRYRPHARDRAEALRAQLEAGRPPAPAPGTGGGDGPPDPFAGGSEDGARAGGPPGAEWSAGPTPVTGTDEGGGGHALLWTGVAAGVVAVGSLIAAIALAGSARGDEEALLRSGWPRVDGRYQIPSDHPDAEVLDAGQTKATWSYALYVVAAATGALSAALVILDLTTSTVTPVPRGALVSTTVRF